MTTLSEMDSLGIVATQASRRLVRIAAIALAGCGHEAAPANTHRHALSIAAASDLEFALPRPGTSMRSL
jgi:exopolyphosphatase/pppGpp-phosphohydrolase